MAADPLPLLQELGFSPYEARAYLALLRVAPANGHEVSRAADVPAAKIYETLGRLEAKGAVVSSRSDPVLYAPVPYPDLLAQLRAATGERLAALERSLEGMTGGPTPGLTWSVTGYDNIRARLQQAVAQSRRELYLALWDQEAPALKAELQDATVRGVALQVALYGRTDLGVPHVYDLRLCGESAAARLGRRLTVLVSDQERVLAAELRGTGRDTAIWTTNSVLALLGKEFIKGDIMGRILINELGEERYQRLRRTHRGLAAMLHPEDEWGTP